MRIVSLLPSATEIVYALGLQAELVGVTFECDEPPGARSDHAVVVGGLDTRGMTPLEIDAHVRRQRAAGADLYHLHTDALAQLDPHLVLTQDLCRVCALPADTVDQALAHLGCRADVLTLDPYTLEDVLHGVEQVAERAGRPDRGTAVVAALRDRLSRVATAVVGRPRPRVAVVEWVEPLFAAGHWIPDLVTAAGGEPVACTPHRPSTTLAWDDVVAAAPDVVVVAPCGYHLDGATEQAGAVADAVGDALPRAEVWAIDADGLIVRPGPRVVDGVEALASVLHPDAVEPDPTRVRRVR